MREYVRGQKVRLKADVRNSAGTRADPVNVTLTLTKPSGATVTKTYSGGEVQKTSTGLYYYELSTHDLLDADLGEWVYSFDTSGTPETADKGLFRLVSEATA